MVTEILKQTEEKFQKSIEALNNEYASIRAGRANPAVLDKIKVDYYGTPTPINQMAAIAVAESRILTISPWDASSMKEIEKAIISSDLGINPTNDGKMLRIAFPQLTEERRKELVKTIASLQENAKVSIRNQRRDCIDKLKKAKKNSEITEDDLRDGEERTQKLTDKFTKEIDIIAAAKEKEVMKV